MNSDYKLSKHNILFFDELNSTNAYALRHLDDLADRQVVAASRQTSGKGRLERRWISENSDNAYLSLVLKPALDIKDIHCLANMTQLMSVALCRVLDRHAVDARIKWPNDVLADGKKIAGILSELRTCGSRFLGFVLGIGVNLGMSQGELDAVGQPAASLNLLLGRPVPRDGFVEELLDQFFSMYEPFLQGGFAVIKEEYARLSLCVGRRVSVTTPLAVECGTVTGISEDGALIIDTGNHREKIIMSGEVACLQTV